MTSYCALKQAEGGFLNNLYPWTHWATLTLREGISAFAFDASLRRFFKSIARVCDDHIPFGYGVGHQLREVLHAHVLLVLPTNVTDPDLLVKTQWRGAHHLAGNTDIRVFDGDRGAAWYTVKHRSWDVNVACPRPPRCRRKRGCIEAPGPL